MLDERFRALAEATAAPVWVTAPNGGVIYANQAFAELTGLTAEQLCGDVWLTLIHPEDVATVTERRDRAFAVGHEPYDFAARFRDADGGWRWMRATGKPQFDCGVFQGYVGIAVDETSARSAAAEASAVQVAEQFRILVQGVVDYALFMLDPDGRVSTWNAGAARIKGYRADEIVGRHFSTFYTEEDRVSKEPEKALETARETGRFEKTSWRVRKDGTRFMANVIIDAVRDDEGRLIGFAKITRDVTEQREAQRELDETREALVQAQKMEMVGQLTGGLAHDFNNMLAGIIGALNLMQRRIAAGRHDDLERYIDAALASANRAASLTSRLLAFGRRASLDIKPVDVAAAISSMEILLTRSIGENIRLNLALEPALAMTDANQLESAILNLAVNARDAMPDGGILDIATRGEENGCVSVIVTDTGAGMAPDVLAKVFDPFFTTKPIGQGTGLGLSMVHGFAKQSGGDVRIESAPGAGTRVVLMLPSAKEAAVARPRPESTGTHEGAGETVLVVEDDPQVRMLVLELLSDLGYAALEAANAREALALLEQQHVDLMVSDVGLPGLNGRQLAEMARARLPSLKILFMTGYAEHAQVRSSFLGADMDLITKPFEIDDIAAKIRAMVGSE